MKFLHHQVALDCPMILIQRLLGLGKGLFGNFQCTGPVRALQPFTSDGCRYPLNWQCLSSAGPEPQIIYVKTAARQTFSTVSEIQHAIIPNKTQRSSISKEQLVPEILIFLQLVTNATQLRASAMLRAWFSETYWTSSWRKNHHSALFHQFNMFNHNDSDWLVSV